MDFRFSDVFLKVLEFSRDEAVRTGWRNISADHIMLAVLRHSDNEACRILEACGVDSAAFKVHIDEAVFCSEQVPWEERESVNLCDSAQSMLQHASLEAARCGSSQVEPLHFLFAVSRIAGCYSHDYLDDCGVSLRSLVEASGLEWSRYGAALLGDGRSQPAMTPSGDGPVILSDSERSAGTPVMPDPIGHLPDPALMAAAIEQRLRDGYATDNPHLS